MATTRDPIFALIERHQNAATAYEQAYFELDEAELAVAERIGRKPPALIHWRNHYIGSSEIEGMRDRLQAIGMQSAAEIEIEYQDAKARIAAAIKAEQSWCERAGIVGLQKSVDAAYAESLAARAALLAQRPATPAGAAAYLDHLLADDVATDCEWHRMALGVIRSGLASLSLQQTANVGVGSAA